MCRKRAGERRKGQTEKYASCSHAFTIDAANRKRVAREDVQPLDGNGVAACDSLKLGGEVSQLARRSLASYG